MTAKVSKKNSFSTLSYQVLWLGSGIRLPRTIPLGPYYVRLYLKENGRTVSENFYVEGREADKLTALNSLPKVALNKKESFAKKGDVHVGEITVANPTATPALLIRLNLVGSDGKQILPVIYSDNYFSLMPGEEKSISVSYNDEDGRGATPSVSLSAFN